MLKSEQIPDAVARLADEAYYDTAGHNPTMSDEDIMKHAIAAALNAWSGMRMQEPHAIKWYPTVLILPLTENPDAE